MSNMSYCRFENTLHDLLDCYTNMDTEGLSESEFVKRERLISLCIKVAKDYGPDDVSNALFALAAKGA